MSVSHSDSNYYLNVFDYNSGAVYEHILLKDHKPYLDSPINATMYVDGRFYIATKAGTCLMF